MSDSDHKTPKPQELPKEEKKGREPPVAHERPRAFATGFDARWPSKDEQNAKK